MAQRKGSLSFNKWLLLLIPVGIAFFVGSTAPTLFGESLNFTSGSIWALLIGIIDYTLLRIIITPTTAILRGIIVCLSVVITALVGDLYIFNTDIDRYIENERKEQYQEQVKEYDKRYDELTELARLEKEGKLIGKKGCGPKCEAYLKERDELKYPTIEDAKVGPLFRVQKLHELIKEDLFASIAFCVFFGLMCILEILPLILKNARLK